ncbi:alcohol dehydrogenase catalytic domain-containing protein, partial [Escherichia coli]
MFQSFCGTILTVGDMFNHLHNIVCSSCLSGRPNACKNNQTLGVQRQGGMAQQLTMPAHKVIVCNA